MIKASTLSSAFYAQIFAKYLNDTNYTMMRDVWPVPDTAIDSRTPPPIAVTYKLTIGA